MSLRSLAALLAALVSLTSCHSKESDDANSKTADTNLFAAPATNESSASAPTSPPQSSPAPAPAAAASTTEPAATSTPPPSSDTMQRLREVYVLDSQGKLDDALAKASAILQADPQNVSAYILRGDINSKKKLFDQAAKDYQSVLQINPGSSVAKFNLSELKFIQKAYDDARPGFVALEKDPDLGDLAAYKVFLCDLFGGHDDVAQKEFDDFNNVGGNASYYFANIAWFAYHKKPDDARSWLQSAARIYPPQKLGLYASSLHDLGYLPLPPPPASN